MYFSWFCLCFMGCMLFVNMRKKREVLLLGCLSVEAGVFLVFVCCFFYQALRASCSSWIIVLLKGLFNLEQKDDTLLICTVTSAPQALMPVPTAATRRVLTFIDDYTHNFTHTLIESNSKASI